MMKREAEVWKAFREALPREVMVRRIEDASGNLGTWDVWLGYMRRGMWVELKHDETVLRRPKLRKGQYAFGLELEAAKVPGCYICGSSDGKVRIISHLYDGEDWESSLIEIWDGMSQENVRGLLEGFGLFGGE